ncbi:hypothetical protein [Paenibacillus periandrae]|uniref:hypothetical protein n=1 Tax=Paenibacillus periandrae TaxID=1761741 RepID=UPI001F08E006|nr:hypothetical protein [Paenibacillus periandrae]
MLEIIVISSLLALFIYMFARGYIKSKREVTQKEKDFRLDLISTIRTQKELTEELEINITELPVRKLSSFLNDNSLIDSESYDRVIKKHFGTGK